MDNEISNAFQRVHERLDRMDDGRKRDHSDLIQRVSRLEQGAESLERPCPVLKGHLREHIDERQRQRDEKGESSAQERSRRESRIRIACTALGAFLGAAAGAAIEAVRWLMGAAS
jgi:hypothetical protein